MATTATLALIRRILWIATSCGRGGGRGGRRRAVIIGHDGSSSCLLSSVTSRQTVACLGTEQLRSKILAGRETQNGPYNTMIHGNWDGFGRSQRCLTKAEPAKQRKRTTGWVTSWGFLDTASWGITLVAMMAEEIRGKLGKLCC